MVLILLVVKGSSKGTDEGVTPQLLRMDLPGVPKDGRAHEDGPLTGTDAGGYDSQGRCKDLSCKAGLGLGKPHL